MMYLISALVMVAVISFVMGYDYGRFRIRPRLLSYGALEFNVRFPKSDTAKRWKHLVNHNNRLDTRIHKIGEVFTDGNDLLVDFKPTKD